MKITYDKEADALYMYLSRGKIKKTVEINSRVLIDVGEEGNVIGVELLFVSERIPKNKIASLVRSLPGATVFQ